MEQIHLQNFKKIESTGKVKKLRTKGTIAAFDIITDQGDGYLNPIAADIKMKCIDKGVLLRPLGNVLYLMPPYCTTEEEIGMVYDKIVELLG